MAMMFWKGAGEGVEREMERREERLMDEVRSGAKPASDNRKVQGGRFEWRKAIPNTDGVLTAAMLMLRLQVPQLVRIRGLVGHLRQVELDALETR